MPTGRRRFPRRGERGFTLVLLIGILTVMGIALAAAIPHWVAIEQRERESELISRGFQFAEAIRVFQQRFGRLPNRLQELVEVKPRSIRQLWKDPMTGKSFLVLIEAPGGQLLPVDPDTGQIVAPPPEPGNGETGEPGEPGQPGEQPPPEGQVTPPQPVPAPGGGEGPGISAPIHGVKSRAHGESYHVLFGKDDVGDWEFTVERLVAAAFAKNPEGMLRRIDYTTIGKPFRYPPPGGVPGEQVGSGRAPRPPRPLPGSGGAPSEGPGR